MNTLKICSDSYPRFFDETNLRDQLKEIDTPYPADLDAQFSGVLNRIAELKIDNWGGTRYGLRPEVASDIFLCSKSRSKLYSGDQNGFGPRDLTNNNSHTAITAMPASKRNYLR